MAISQRIELMLALARCGRTDDALHQLALATRFAHHSDCERRLVCVRCPFAYAGGWLDRRNGQHGILICYFRALRLLHDPSLQRKEVGCTGPFRIPWFSLGRYGEQRVERHNLIGKGFRTLVC